MAGVVIMGIVDFGYYKQLRVDYSQHELQHINGIESLEIHKSKVTRFKGIPKTTFYLHLKECEFRFIIEEVIYIKLC